MTERAVVMARMWAILRVSRSDWIEHDVAVRSILRKGTRGGMLEVHDGDTLVGQVSMSG